jgi:hypothetical protein
MGVRVDTEHECVRAGWYSKVSQFGHIVIDGKLQSRWCLLTDTLADACANAMSR